MLKRNKYLLVIAGPTASGKTDIAIQIAQHLNTEIISADARQFYQEMDIGTAKPDAGQLLAVKHHFINNLSVRDIYDAGKFEAEVLELFSALFQKHNVLIVCGGSGLFIHAILHGLDIFPEISNGLREMLIEKLQTEGLASLQELLKEKDPVYYAETDLHNPKRIVRALEICLTTGLPFSTLRKNTPKKRDFIPVKICLYPGRAIVYENINRRVDAMMENGLLEEAKALYPLSKDNNALNTVGYKELFAYLDGQYDLTEATDKIKQHTRNYAKRQLTWFRKDSSYIWFNPLEREKILAFIDQTIQ